MVLQVYVDLLSQPARSIWTLCKVSGIEFETKLIDLMKDGNKDPAYLKINPAGQIPCIVDEGFNLAESTRHQNMAICTRDTLIHADIIVCSNSVAIMQYLCEKYPEADKYFPRADFKLRARITEVCQWYPSAIRAHGVGIFLGTMFGLNKDKVDEHKEKMKVSILQLEERFLKDNAFLCGAKMSIADILVASELLHMNGCKEEAVLKTKSGNVSGWLERVKKEIGSAIYKEGFSKIDNFYKNFMEMQSAKK